MRPLEMVRLRFALVALALTTTSCFLERTVAPTHGHDAGQGVDAGPPPDAGTPADAGPSAMDAGPSTIDAGPSTMDAGPSAMDAGPSAMDAGTRDAGAMDAGARDAGPSDAGVDACAMLRERCNGVDEPDCAGSPDSEACDAADCTPITHDSGDGEGPRFYLFCTEEMSWIAARGACQTEGLDLVIVDSMMEQTYVWSEAQAAPLSLGEMWLGMYERVRDADDRVETKKYYWVGDPGTLAWNGAVKPSGAYENWRGGAPDNEDGEACIQFDTDGDPDGQWADHPCGSHLPFVCEGPAAAAVARP